MLGPNFLSVGNNQTTHELHSRHEYPCAYLNSHPQAVSECYQTQCIMIAAHAIIASYALHFSIPGPHSWRQC